MFQKRFTFQLVLVLLPALLALSACSQAAQTPAGPTVVHATLHDFTITLDRNTIPAGPVQFVIQNQGTVMHEVVLENVGDVDKGFEANGQTAEAGNINPGQSSVLLWTLDKPGQYQLACHQPAHYKAGMVTTFTVAN